MDELITIGPFLKKKREEIGISLDECAKQTKINRKLLEHLEQDRLGQLPSKVYVMGFIKNLSKKYSIDENHSLEILEYTYEQKLGGLNLNEDENIEKIEAENLSDQKDTFLKAFINKKSVLVIIIALICIGVFKTGHRFFSSIQKTTQDKKEMTLADPIIKISNQSLTSEPDIKSKDESLFDLNIEDKIQNNILDEKDEPEKQAVEQTEQKEVKKQSSKLFPYKRFYKMKKEHYSLISKPELLNTPSFPAKYVKDLIPEIQNLFVHAEKQDAWISYQKQNEPIKSFLLKKGKMISISSETILFFTGKLSGLTIFLNNQLVQASSKTDVKSFIFPKHRSAEFWMPLFPSHKGVLYTPKQYKEKMSPAP